MKKILIFLMALILCISFAACGSSDSDEEPSVEKTVAAVAEAMGFEGEGEEKAYEMVEADDGAGFGDYEIYIFNDENSEAYQALAGDGYDYIFGPIKADAANAGVVLIYNGDSEPDQATLDKFNALNIK